MFIVMGKTVKLNEKMLRDMIMLEVRKMAGKRLNEVSVRSTDELADGSYERMCGMLKGKIESLLMWKDSCKTLEELQHLIDRTFENIID